MRGLGAIFIVLLILAGLVGSAYAATVVVPGLPPVVIPEPNPANIDGLVLYLPMDEGSGNVTYNAVDPTVNNGTIYGANWTPGKLGYGLAFDGTNDYVEVPNSPDFAVNQFTIAFWMYPTRDGVFEGLVSKTVWLNGDGGFLVIKHQNPDYGLTFVIDDGTSVQNLNLNKRLDLNRWYFVTAVYDGTTMKLYINAVLEAERSANPPAQNTRTLIIGAKAPTQDFFEGILDEVYIFSRALSDKEIQLLYQRGKPDHVITNIQPDLRQISVPQINIDRNSTVTASFEIKTNVANALIPIPANAKVINAKWAYNIDGKVLSIDDNRYVNQSSVTVEIPIKIDTYDVKQIPNELYLDEDTKTFEYKKIISIYNPSDINVMSTISVDPAEIGVSSAELDGSLMSMMNDRFVSTLLLSPGANEFELTATLPIAKQEVEFRSTYEDFLEIDSLEEAKTLAENARKGKIETITKVVEIESAVDIGNRSVIIPLSVEVDDVIEAKALTGSGQLLEVREGKDGKAEVVVPASAFNEAHVAQIKILYNKKPSIFERFGFLSVLSSIIEKIKSIFGGG